MADPVLLFDVFRTLLAFDGDHVEPTTFPTLAAWLRHHGVDRIEGPELRARFEHTTARHLAAAPGAHPDVEVVGVWREVLDPLPRWGPPPEDLAARTATLYRTLTTRHIDLWPGTLEMLDACADVRLAIASNTQRAYTETELRMLGLDGRFEVVVFSSDVRACKPDPAIFEAALTELEVTPDEVVYLGDNPYDDVLGAHRAGIATVLLDRGTPFPAGVELLEPLARVPGDEPVRAVQVARTHLGIAR